MSAVKCSVERNAIETSDGVKLKARIFKVEEEEEESAKDNLVVVLVHPYSKFGGCQGYLRGIALRLASRGYKAVTFDMRGAGGSTGKASFTGFKEIQDVVAVSRWASRNLSADRILLVGSSAGLGAISWCQGKLVFEWTTYELISLSFLTTLNVHLLSLPLVLTISSILSATGAPIAGSAVGKIEQVVGYVSLGYPFGLLASILFGRHHKAILRSPIPKLFVMGTRDLFTSVRQLKNKLKSAQGRIDTHLLEGVNHSELGTTAYDDEMVNLILTFIASLQTDKQC